MAPTHRCNFVMLYNVVDNVSRKDTRTFLVHCKHPIYQCRLYVSRNTAMTGSNGGIKTDVKSNLVEKYTSAASTEDMSMTPYSRRI